MLDAACKHLRDLSVSGLSVEGGAQSVFQCKSSHVLQVCMLIRLRQGPILEVCDTPDPFTCPGAV